MDAKKIIERLRDTAEHGTASPFGVSRTDALHAADILEAALAECAAWRAGDCAADMIGNMLADEYGPQKSGEDAAWVRDHGRPLAHVIRDARAALDAAVERGEGKR